VLRIACTTAYERGAVDDQSGRSRRRTVRQCAAASRGGASAYLERLIREDEMREAIVEELGEGA
jgi:hypothetical protein